MSGKETRFLINYIEDALDVYLKNLKEVILSNLDGVPVQDRVDRIRNLRFTFQHGDDFAEEFVPNAPPLYFFLSPSAKAKGKLAELPQDETEYEDGESDACNCQNCINRDKRRFEKALKDAKRDGNIWKGADEIENFAEKLKEVGKKLKQHEEELGCPTQVYIDPHELFVGISNAIDEHSCDSTGCCCNGTETHDKERDQSREQINTDGLLWSREHPIRIAPEPDVEEERIREANREIEEHLFGGSVRHRHNDFVDGLFGDMEWKLEIKKRLDSEYYDNLRKIYDGDYKDLKEDKDDGANT